MEAEIARSGARTLPQEDMLARTFPLPGHGEARMPGGQHRGPAPAKKKICRNDAELNKMMGLFFFFFFFFFFSREGVAALCRMIAALQKESCTSREREALSSRHQTARRCK